MDRPLHMGKECKKSISHVNVHQKVTSAEETFNNQMDRMTCSVESSQPLLSLDTTIAQWAHRQSGHVGRTGIMVGLTSTDFHSIKMT